MNPNENELYHHGIKGMRWGVRRTPEQLGYRVTKKRKKLDKTYEQAREAASKRNMKKLEKLSKKAVKQAKGVEKAQTKYDAAKELEAKLKEEQARQLEEKKDRIFKSGNAAEIYANRELFSTNELNDAINRANAMTRLKDINKQDTVIKMDKARQFIDGVAGVGKSLKGAADSYNDLAKVVNSIAGEKKLPTFETKGTGDALEKILRSGDANKIAKALPYMDAKQVKDASERLSNERKIRAYAESASSKTDDSSKSDSSKSAGVDKAPTEGWKNLSDNFKSTKSTKTDSAGTNKAPTEGWRNLSDNFNTTGYTNSSKLKDQTAKAPSSESYYTSGGTYATYSSGKTYVDSNTTKYNKTSWKEAGSVTGDFYRDGNKYMRDNANTWAKVTLDYKTLEK